MNRRSILGSIAGLAAGNATSTASLPPAAPMGFASSTASLAVPLYGPGSRFARFVARHGFPEEILRARIASNVKYTGELHVPPHIEALRSVSPSVKRLMAAEHHARLTLHDMIEGNPWDVMLDTWLKK